MTTFGSQPSAFLLMVTGQIDTAHFPELPDLYCKYCFTYGSDWTITSGLEEGISQIAKKNPTGAGQLSFALNFPLDISFRSTNPHGCRHKRRLAMFVPESSSTLQQAVGWLLGRKPEFIDPRIVAMTEGREVTRVRTQGYIEVSFNTLFKDTKRLGYDLTPRGVHVLSEFPLTLPTTSDAAIAEIQQPKLPSRHASAEQYSDESDSDTQAQMEPPQDPTTSAAALSTVHQVMETAKDETEVRAAARKRKLFSFFGSERREGGTDQGGPPEATELPPLKPPRQSRQPVMETLAEDDDETAT